MTLGLCLTNWVVSEVADLCLLHDQKAAKLSLLEAGHKKTNDVISERV